MPQFQLVPHVPGIAESLIAAISRAGKDVSDAYQKRNYSEALSKLLEGGDYSSAAPPHGSAPGNAAASSPQATNAPAMASQSAINPGRIGLISRYAEKVGGPHFSAAVSAAEQKRQELIAKESYKVAGEERAREGKYEEAEVIPFIEQIAKDRLNLPGAMQANDQIIDAVIKGNVGPTSLANFSNLLLDIGVPESIAKSLRSTDAKEILNGIKNNMGRTIKDLFRGNTTQTEIGLAESMNAEIGVTKEGNLAAAFANQADLLARQEQVRLYGELVEQGIKRSKIPAIIEKQMIPIRKYLHDQYFEAIDHLRNNKAAAPPQAAPSLTTDQIMQDLMNGRGGI